MDVSVGQGNIENIPLRRTAAAEEHLFAVWRNRRIEKPPRDAIHHPAASVSGVRNKHGVFEITTVDGKVTAVGKPARIAPENAQVSGGAGRILQNPKLPKENCAEPGPIR